MSIRGASHAVGLCESTIYRWRQDNPEIEQAVQSAIAKSEKQLVELALEGAKKDGRIALMMLERRFPDSWSKHSEHRHLHAHTGTDVLSVLTASREARDARLAAEAVPTLDAELVED